MVWITVKEQMPEEHLWVLFLHNEEFVEMGVYMKAVGFCDPDRGYLSFSNVTHWMPLPTPPKEKVNE